MRKMSGHKLRYLWAERDDRYRRFRVRLTESEKEIVREYRRMELAQAIIPGVVEARQDLRDWLAP